MLSFRHEITENSELQCQKYSLKDDTTIIVDIRDKSTTELREQVAVHVKHIPPQAHPPAIAH